MRDYGKTAWIVVVGFVLALGARAAVAQSIGTERLVSGLAFPTYLTAPPGDLDRIFVTERFGDIEIIDVATGVRNPLPFLTVPGVAGEGLQGLAFHPDYDVNGFFYVYYYGSAQSQVVRFTVSGDPDRATVGSAFTIIKISQPAAGHNGGWIGFGPDQYLYVPLGDGGIQHDPDDHSQTIEDDLLGAVLRIDVDGDDFPGDPDRNYAIPQTNPFVGVAGDDEIWAYGLRNPFRSSFDRATGDLYIADVGQTAWEEVNFQPAASTGGENYGWRLREGLVATPTGGFGGPLAGRTDPIYAYANGTGTDQGKSVTGGYVYRGSLAPLVGKYFFADFVNERIWSIEHDGAAVTERLDWTNTLKPPSGQGTIDQIVGFGEDAAGDLYIVDLGGEIFRVAELRATTTTARPATATTSMTSSTSSSTTSTTRPPGPCSPSPQAGCLTAGKTSILIKNSSNDTADQLRWKWRRGEAVRQGDLGEPSTTAAYTLCIYDTTAGVPSVVGAVTVGPNARWQNKRPKGWKYRNKAGTQDGVRKARLKTGAPGKARAQIRARGRSLPTPSPGSATRFFSQDPSVTVQLVNTRTTTCWTSRFVTAGKNTGVQFKAAAP